MKKLIIILSSLLFFSCMKSELSLNIKDDLSGDVSFKAGLSKEGKELLNSISEKKIDDSLIDSSKFEKVLHFDDLKDFSPSFLEYNTSDNLTKIKIILSNEGLDLLKLGELKDYVFLFETYFKDSYLQVEIKTPKDIKDSSGCEVKEKNSLSCQINIFDLLTSKNIIEFSF